jgi:hypothetical protein
MPLGFQKRSVSSRILSRFKPAVTGPALRVRLGRWTCLCGIRLCHRPGPAARMLRRSTRQGRSALKGRPPDR